MKQSKMPADPNRRAKATVDIIDAIFDGKPPEKDPERVAREARRCEGREAPGGQAHARATLRNR
jgi:hypothetical protein